MTHQTWYTLSQLNRLIRGAISRWSDEAGDLLVVGEVSDFRRGPTGHYYLRLVERRDEGIVAELDAVIWSRYGKSVDDFRKETGTGIAPGMELLVRGRVSYHERYGLKLEISGIDPTYTLGEMQRQKREVIARLEREQLLDRNRRIAMPLVPQRIAVITSPGSAGHQDFVDQLARNAYGYALRLTAFAALVQGNEAEASIASAFEIVAGHSDEYDAVALIRGGGSQVDLSCFDTYGVAAAIAHCRLPVITGIGHEKDETVADMVAHTRAKTPTAAAEVILAAVRAYEERVEDYWARIGRGAAELLGRATPEVAALRDRLAAGATGRAALERERVVTAVNGLAGRTLGSLRIHLEHLETASRLLWQEAHGVTMASTQKVHASAMQLRVLAQGTLRDRAMGLDALAKDLEHLDPARVLARGFSITRHGGAVVRDSATVPEGAAIETTLARGRIVSRVEQREEHGEEGSADVRSSD